MRHTIGRTQSALLYHPRPPHEACMKQRMSLCQILMSAEFRHGVPQSGTSRLIDYGDGIQYCHATRPRFIVSTLGHYRSMELVYVVPPPKPRRWLELNLAPALSSPRNVGGHTPSDECPNLISHSEKVLWLCVTIICKTARSNSMPWFRLKAKQVWPDILRTLDGRVEGI